MNERNIKNNNKYAKKIGLRRMIASFLLLPLLSISAYLYSQYAHAAITKEISYQGKLTNAAGVSVADGNYSMVISLYTAASGGTPVWTARGTVGSPTARTVTVTNGIFSIMLGDTAAGDNAIALDFNSTYYLGIKVGSDTEMTPRKKVGASGYAFNADMLDGLDSATSGANAHIVATDASGNLTVSGDVNVNGGDINSTTTLTLNPTGNLNFQSASYYVNESGQMVLNTNETINGIDINAGAISDVTTFSSTYLATGASYVDIIGSAELRMGGTSVLTSARALQNITSATIDNIYIDGTTIGHTSDTDLLNLASNVLTVNGTLDLNGPIDLDVSVNDYAANFYNSNTGAAAGGLYIRTDGAGNLLTLNASGTDVMTISSTQASFNVPTAFTASGDVSMAYDLIFTNQTASNIKTNAPFTIEVGELFESNDLTLRTFNNGDVVLDAAGGVTLMQAQPWMLASGTSALNFQNSSGTSILNIDSTNNRVGIGTTTPSKALHLYSAAASEAILIESDYISAWLELDRASSGTNAAINLKTAGVERFNFGLANDSTENFYIGNSGFATKYFTINTSGNIGLGTTSPAEILDVNGRMRLAQTTAPATTTDKLYNVTGNLYWNGVNLTGGGSLPSGTSGQTLRHNGSGWVANSLLYNNGTNVGIGTTSPGSKLHVFGGAIYQSSVAGAAGYMNTNYSQLASTTNRNPGILVFGGSAGSEYGMDLGYNGAYRTRIFTSGSQDIAFAKLNSPATSQTDFVELMTIKNSGNVGIGTTSPGYLLTLADNNGIGIGAIRVISKDTGTGGAIHIGTGGSGFTGALNFDSNGGNKWAVSNAGNTTQSGTLTVSGTGNSSIAGNVGIGTTSPVEKLHVAGSTYTYLNITSDDTGHTSSDGMTIGLTASTASPANVGLVSVRENWPMVFMTNGSENMRISNTGNVGIGTNNPGAKLNVNGGTTGRYTALRLSHAGGLVNDDISLELWPASSYVTAPAKIIGTAVGGDAAGLEFNVSNLGVLNSAMVIDKLGNVGIGTTSPVARLQSSGAAQVNSPTLGSANGGGLYVTNTDFAYGLLAGVATSGNVWLQAQRTDSTATAYNILLQPSGGNVGIGTSNPGARLDVVGGAIRTNNQLISTIATGTAPLAVTSTTLNTNLNADLLDGQHGSYYATTASISGTDNYIPRFNGTSALENSNIYDNGTNIGIGTTTVPALLTVGSTGQFRVTSAGAVTATTYNGLGLTSAADGFTIAGGTTSRTLSVTGGNFTVSGGGNTLTMTGNSSLNQNLLTTSAPTFAGLTLNGNLDLNGAIDLDVSVNDYAANFYNTNTGAAAGGLYIRTDGTGNLLTLNASGTDVVTISPTQASFNVPTSFTASGDVSMAYDLIFTNQTSSNIKTSSAFTIEVGEIFESNDLTLRTLNSGHVVLDAAGGVRLSQAQTWDLAAGTSALNFQNSSGTSILNIDSTNARIGIGTNVPSTLLHLGNTAYTFAASGMSFGDGDTGLYESADDTLQVYVAGFNRLSFTTNGIYPSANDTRDLGSDSLRWRDIYGVDGFFSGNIGIGTTSPAEILDVNGRMRLAQTTAPATTTDKLYNVTGNLYWNGVNLTGGGALPSGTSGQTLRHNGTAWIANSVLYNNGTNIGIGTTSPGAKLDISGVVYNSAPGVLIQGTSSSTSLASDYASLTFVNSNQTANNYSGIMFSDNAGGNNATAGIYAIYTDHVNNYGDFAFTTKSAGGYMEKMRITSGGNVGIGTTSPLSKLHVAEDNVSGVQLLITGATNVNERMYVGFDTDNDYGRIDAIEEGVAWRNLVLQSGGGNVGIGTTSPSRQLSVNGTNPIISSQDGTTEALFYANSGIAKFGAGSNSPVGFQINGNEFMRISTGGNVGIGTANPQAKLQILGTSGDATTYGIMSFDTDSGLNDVGIKLGSVAGMGTAGYSFIQSKHTGIANDANLSLNPAGGSIAIGTTNPIVKTHIVDTNTNQVGLVIGAPLASSEVTGIGFQGYVAGGNSIKSAIYHQRTGTWGTGDLHFALNGLLDGTNVSMSDVKMTIRNSGNVGIGTTTPAEILDVNGRMRLAQVTAPGTTTDKLYNVTGNLYWNGVNLTGGGALPSGTSGQTLRHNGTSWIANSVLYNNGTNIGIGTTSPGARLHVYESTGLGGTLGNSQIISTFAGFSGTLNVIKHNEWLYRDAAGTDWLTARLHDGISVDASFLTPGTNTKTWWERDPQHNIQSWGDAASTYLTINAGNVGIGTTNPTKKLQVTDTYNVYVGGSGLGTGANIYADNSMYLGTITANSLNIETADVTRLSIGGTGDFSFNSGQAFLQQSTGNFGIGTTTPGAKLEIVDSKTHVSGDLAGTDALLRLYNNYGVDVAEKGAVITFEDNYLGTTRTTRAAIKGGTATSGNTADGFLAFYTDASGANSMQERMRINYNGNVGIGTTNPGTRLDVVGGAIRTNNQLISTIATGTAPLAVTSTTLNTNLNADLLDGHDTSYFQTALTNPVTGTGTNGYNAYWTGTNTIGAEQYTAVTRGGTGVGTFTTGGILYGNGTSAIQATAVMTNGQLLIGDGTGAPTLATLTQGNAITVTNGAGSISIGVTNDSIGDTQLAFNTGQHLTTTSSPTFAGLTINGSITASGGLVNSPINGIGENVWRYSSFESSLANMTPYHSVNSNSSVSTDRHLAGLQSLTQPLTTSTTTGYYGHDYVAGDSGAYELKPNTTYTFSAWAYITGDAAADAMLQLENTYTNVDITNRSTTVHDQWVQLWRTFTTPAAGSTTRALLYAHLNTGTTNATIYWDKVMMVEGDMRTKWYADNNEVYGKLNVVGDIYGSLDLVVDGGDIANSGVGIDIGEAYTTGALFSQINDNAYFDIYCADSGGNDLCEFKTGIFNNGGTFYSQNQIIARGGIMNDTASTALSLNDADGVIFAGPISGITTASLSGQITSTLATGTAPFAVTSTTLNTNLNADLLDGQHGTYYATAASISGTDNYIPRFNGTSALENSNIYDNGTNIGIGTTTPGAKLDVRGGISAGTSGTQFVVSTAGLITAGTWNATSISDAYIDNNITISGGTIGSNNISGTLTTTGALTIGDNGDNIVLSGANVDIYSNGSATFGTTSSASNTIITALSSDSYNAGFEAYGLGQGTGYFYAGQSTTHGGGIFYSGDGTPAFATGEGNDRISFYRRNASVNEVAFSYAYSSNDVTFRGNVFSELGISTYDTTVADNTIETGQLCLGNGTNCITSWTNAGGNVDGSGTLNYLSKWTPDGNTIGNSIIYDNGTNIGIGTTSPGEKLEIGGGNLRVWNDNELGGELTSWVNNPSHPYETFTTSGTDITSAINTTLYGMTYTQINAVAGELYKVTFNMTLNSGAMPTFRVGPSSTLTVYALSKTITSGSNTFYFYAAATGNMYVGLYTASGAATDYSVSGYSLQKVTGGNVIASGQFTGGGVSGLKIDASGNVGIGTTTPGALLDVVGGAVRTNNQLISTIATGTAPLSVASTTVVTNLNADMVDGYHLNQNVLTSSSPTFAGLTLNGNLALGGNTITTSNTGLISNLNADLLDGQHGSYYDQRVYSSATNYLGGGYVSGGLEKPNWAGFGAGKLKLQMLSGTNIGGGGTWNDVLWLSSYTGSDVKGSYALVFNKYADEVGFIRQAYDATDWGTYQKLWHTGNDGSGSTLDADLLDGHDTSYFQTALTNPVTGTGTNGYNAYWTGTNTIGAEQYTAVSRGGTGVGTLTTGGILYGNGTSAIQATAVMTNGQLLIGDGTGAPTLATLTQGNAITVTNGAGSISIGVTNDSISDTQLAFNTGQHLTTTSSPTFAGLTLNGNLVLGSNTITTTNTNVITNLNADLLDGYHGGSYVHIGAYNNTNGYLIATDIAAASDTMFEMDIIGNSYGSLQPIHITIQGYNYNTGNAIINTAGLAEDWTRSVSVFNYNGYLYFWLDQSSSYQSIAAYVRRTQDSSPRNRVTGITNEVKPTTGVTREVAITPKQAWNSGNDGSGSTLDADLLDGHDTSYFQTALTNPVTGTGTNGYNAYWTGTNTIGAEQYTAVSRGGTGVGTLTTGGILYGNGTSAIQATAVMTNGQLLIGDGSGVPTLATLTQGSNIAITNGAGSITIATSATPSFTTINGLTLAAAADGFTISGGTTSRTLTITGSDVAINQNLQTTNSPTFARTYVSGLSTSWGSTNGVNTGGVNVTMGTSSSATWLISGTSGGTFRAGIQALDSNGQLRIYSNSSYLTISGNTISMSGQLTSTLATGTAPLAVTSTTLNTNLNADLLDGQHGAYYATAASISGTDNYIPRFNGTSALENSIMYDTGTNVGIGTTSPGAKLEVSTGALGTSLNDVVEMQRISGSSSNASYIDFRHIRTSAGSDWSTAGLRVQSKVDATWLGYMQFNGNANGGGISFGTGTTTTAPGNVSESMRIDGVGRVGIGTTGPGSKLDVRGGGGGTVDLYVSGRIKTGDGNNNGGVWLDAASTQFVGQYSANTLGIYNNNNWGLVVNNSGSVGMGTTSPGAKLDIQGGSLRVGSAAIASANAGDISISREGDPTSGYMYFGNAGTNYFGYNGSGYTFNAKSTINGSTGAINVGSGISNSTVVIAGTNTYDTAVSGYKQIGALYSSNTMGADVGAGLTLGGIYTGTSKTDFAQIAGIKENATDGNYSGALTLYTRQNGNVALQERMRIDSAGLVGIGTTTPVEALDINGRLRLAQTTAPADTTNKLYNVSGNLYWNGINLSGGAMPSGTTGQTLRHDGTNWVANSVLYNNGTNIGIGSTSPSAKLDVLSSTTPQFSLGYDASNKMSVSVASSGTVTFATKTMSDTYAGYNNPSSASSSYWSNPTYVYSSDDTYASQYAVGSSGAIQATNFGFSIPTNAIIKGVQVVVEGHATLNGVQESNVQLVVGGVAQGSDRSVASVWGLSDVAYTSGGTEDTWGLSTLTPAVVNASNFGATVTLNSTSAAFEYIDSIRIRVYYSTNYAPFAFTNYVGIGTTAPTEKLQVVGGVRFSNFGAGTLQTDANGVLTVSSDENLKNIDSSFDRGLEAIMNINPISYHWKGSSGLDTMNEYTGFSAQNVKKSIPEAIGVDSRGFLTLTDRPILAAAVNAIKQQQGQLKDLNLKTDANVSSIMGLKESVDQQLTSVSLKFASQDEAISTVNQKIADMDLLLNFMKTSLDDQKVIVDKINEQMELIKSQNEAILDFAIALDAEKLIYKDEAGNIDLLNGKVTATEMVAGVFTVKITDPEARTIGEAIIRSGSSNVEIKTRAVTDNSKIFVTAKVASEYPLAVTQKKSGEGFVVSVKGNVTEDVSFDWWIVESKDDTENVTRAVPVTQASVSFEGPIDSDGDGLVDEEELRIGTNQYSYDTDGDGFLDGDELRFGYNPLVASDGNKGDKIIFDDPKVAGVIDDSYVIINSAFSDNGAGWYKLDSNGTVPANRPVTVFVYGPEGLNSTVGTIADAEGNWNITVNKDFADGAYEIYVVQTNIDGSITSKSGAFITSK